MCRGLTWAADPGCAQEAAGAGAAGDLGLAPPSRSFSFSFPSPLPFPWEITALMWEGTGLSLSRTP